MRVVVTGLVATYPVGGVAWDYLQYLEGFRALGWDVWYLEDTGRWVYDPVARTFTPDVRGNVRWLADALRWLDPALADRFAVRDPDGALHGLDEARLAAVCRDADLLLNVSGSCWLRDAYRAARVAAYVDTDPLYSQAKIAAVDAGTVDPETIASVALLRRHDVFFTLGAHVGAPDCEIPTCGITWHPTWPPIVLDRWPTDAPPGEAFTTVMSWKIEPPAPIVGGKVYGAKEVEFERIVDLPRRTSRPLEVAISGPAPRERLVAAGWRVVDAAAVSATMADYRDYLARSRGELSIAKNAYVASRSGWFSTRTASYLACGRPAVVQDTGFAAHVPTGPGLHAFRTAEEALAAVAVIDADWPAASRHARQVAAERLDARRVCARLAADAGL